MDMLALPESLTAALFGAALAAIGFVVKQVLEWMVSLRATRRARRTRLATLLSLLNGSAAVYHVQAVLRDRLHETLLKRDPNARNVSTGYDAVFSAAYPTLTAEERELHTMIRAYTVSGLRPLNEAMRQWLQADTEFKLPRSRDRSHQALARQLGALEPHLLMWLAKYAAWIPDTPAHALVYVGDEKIHGVPFPKGIERTIEQTLGVRPLFAVRSEEPRPAI